MPHPRTLIRQAVKAALLNATTAADRVHTSRSVAWRPKDLPAIAIYTLEEEVDPSSANSAPRELKRNLSLAVEVAAVQQASIDDELDALAQEVERAICADDTLGGKASDIVLASTNVDILADGERIIGVMRLEFAATYYTFAPDAEDVPLPDFETSNIRYKLGNAVYQDNEAVDDLTVFIPPSAYTPSLNFSNPLNLQYIGGGLI